MLTALQHFNIFFNCQLQKWHKEVRQGAHSFYTFLSLTILLILSMTKCIILMLIVHLTFYLTFFPFFTTVQHLLFVLVARIFIKFSSTAQRPNELCISECELEKPSTISFMKLWFYGFDQQGTKIL